MWVYSIKQSKRINVHTFNTINIHTYVRIMCIHICTFIQRMYQIKTGRTEDKYYYNKWINRF